MRECFLLCFFCVCCCGTGFGGFLDVGSWELADDFE